MSITVDNVEEQFFALAHGRTLAYASAGSSQSTTVLLYLHGSFTVGEISRSSRVITAKNVHHICPTLPGWGNTSPPPPSVPYVDCLLSDMTALLDHLYPDRDTEIKLYIAGGSFGTVPAQILYGAPYSKFPYGRRIAGVLLLAPATPFFYHRDYAQHMTWSNYFMVGPPTQYLPFKGLLVQLVKLSMARKMSTMEKAENFIRSTIFDKMDVEERREYEGWRVKEGIEEGETERRMARNLTRSVATSWEGFKLMLTVLHSDWGFRPGGLDEEHCRPLVTIVTSSGDPLCPEAWSRYLADTYKNTRLKAIHGGHIAALYHLNELWAEFLADEE